MDPSHVVLSDGRPDGTPPGSAHSAIVSPEGRAVWFGNPLPDTVTTCPSVYGPAEMFADVAAKAVPLDEQKYRLSKGISRIKSNSAVKIGEVIVVSSDYVDYKIAGIVTAEEKGSFTISYIPAGIDTTKNYSLYHWVDGKKL